MMIITYTGITWDIYIDIYVYTICMYIHMYLQYVYIYIYNQINMILGVSEKRVIALPTWPWYKWTMGKMPTQGNGRYPIFRRKQGTMNKNPWTFGMLTTQNGILTMKHWISTMKQQHFQGWVMGIFNHVIYNQLYSEAGFDWPRSGTVISCDTFIKIEIKHAKIRIPDHAIHGTYGTYGYSDAG